MFVFCFINKSAFCNIFCIFLSELAQIELWIFWGNIVTKLVELHPNGLHKNPQFVLKPFGHPKRDHIEPTQSHNPHTTNDVITPGSRPVAGRLPALDCAPSQCAPTAPSIEFRLQHWPPFIAHRFTHTWTLCGFYAWSTNEHRSSQRHVRASAIQLSRVPGDRRRRICTPPAKQTPPRSVWYAGRMLCACACARLFTRPHWLGGRLIETAGRRRLWAAQLCGCTCSYSVVPHTRMSLFMFWLASTATQTKG